MTAVLAGGDARPDHVGPRLSLAVTLPRPGPVACSTPRAENSGAASCPRTVHARPPGWVARYEAYRESGYDESPILFMPGMECAVPPNGRTAQTVRPRVTLLTGPPLSHSCQLARARPVQAPTDPTLRFAVTTLAPRRGGLRPPPKPPCAVTITDSVAGPRWPAVRTRCALRRRASRGLCTGSRARTAAAGRRAPLLATAA
eukprot:3190902-Prymnesium_polylepis.2